MLLIDPWASRGLVSCGFKQAFRVMSFNVRSDEGDSRYHWGLRKRHVLTTILANLPDLIGLQEPLKNQVRDLQEGLADFGRFSVGLNDACEEGMHNPVLFRKTRFIPLDFGLFYLSETPQIPSRSWNSRFFRGVTWAKLFDKVCSKPFFLFNTHFDYHSRLARDESSMLLREKIGSIAQDRPFVVTGDFNLFPQLGGDSTYRLLTEDSISGRPLVDAQKVSLFPHRGPTGSWSGFKEAGQPGIKPDYVFVDRQIRVYSHAIVADTFEGRFPSDHLPVFADLSIS